MSKDLDFHGLSAKLAGAVGKLRRYSLLLFVVFVAAVYAFVLLRVHSLGSAEPSQQDVTSQVQAARTPRINQTVVQQLESLQDNSVNVHSLFDQARSNPFQ